MSKQPDGHGLRTTGRHTGNFGKPKVQGKAKYLEISKQTLNKKDLVIPTKEEAFAKVKEAYNKTADPKLKKGLYEMIRVYEASKAKR